MKNKILILLALLICNSCIKKSNDCRVDADFTKHVFEIPITLTPANDTFRVGDTISVIAEFPDTVFDLTTQLTYFLEDFKFNPILLIGDIGKENGLDDALQDFELIIDGKFTFNQFNFSDGAISYVGEYNYEDGKYFLAYKIVPQKVGLFHFSHFSDVNSTVENQGFLGRCNGVGLDINVKLNDGVDNNIDFLNNSPDPHFNDWMLIKPGERFHKFGGYCFYVVE